MADGYREGHVYIQNIFAGIIKETDEGYEFAYDGGYLGRKDAAAVSLTMPLTEKEYKSAILFPFFDGLIPEGWLLEVAKRNWKIDAGDRFGLRLTVCRDCIGDVSVWSKAGADTPERRSP